MTQCYSFYRYDWSFVRINRESIRNHLGIHLFEDFIVHKPNPSVHSPFWIRGSVTTYNKAESMNDVTMAHAMQACLNDPECEYILDHGCDHTLFQDDTAFGVVKISDSTSQDNHGKLYSETSDRHWRVVKSSQISDLKLYPDHEWNSMSRSGIPHCVLKKPTSSKEKVENALEFEVGTPIQCTANDVGSGVNTAVYRYMGGTELRHYPNPSIASSWDPDWRTTVKKIDCEGLTEGDKMLYNLKVLDDGVSKDEFLITVQNMWKHTAVESPQVSLHGDIYGDALSSQSNVNIKGTPVWGYPSTPNYTIARVPETLSGGPVYANPVSGASPQYVCALDGRNGIVKFSYFDIKNGQYVHKIRAWMASTDSRITNLGDFRGLVDAGTISMEEIFSYTILGASLSHNTGFYYVLAAVSTVPLDCQSPWFVWQTWKNDVMYSDVRVCFDVGYQEWLEGHNDDSPSSALKAASKWQIKVPSENVNLEAQGELVRAVMYRTEFGNQSKYGLHYKRT